MSAAPSVVVVTEPEFRRAESTFQSGPFTCIAAPPSEAEVARAIQESGARHAILGPFVYSSLLYSALPRGGVLARFGVGHDGIDKGRATAAGLLCTNTPGVLHQSVAELTLLLLLAAARRLEELTTAMRGGRWSPVPGVELRGKTLAIVGCGIIGRATAQIARHGFGLRVRGYRRSTAPAAGDDDFDTFTNDFETAVHDADYVSLHIPASPENAGFVDAKRLGMMQKHAWLVNTARGSVVNERDLYDALEGRLIGGAALDVFEREPYVPAPGKDLRTLANVIAVPHVGSNTREANVRMAARALQNLTLAERRDFGGMDLLNPEVLNTRA